MTSARCTANQSRKSRASSRAPQAHSLPLSVGRELTWMRRAKGRHSTSLADQGLLHWTLLRTWARCASRLASQQVQVRAASPHLKKSGSLIYPPQPITWPRMPCRPRLPPALHCADPALRQDALLDPCASSEWHQCTMASSYHLAGACVSVCACVRVKTMIRTVMGRGGMIKSACAGWNVIV